MVEGQSVQPKVNSAEAFGPARKPLKQPNREIQVSVSFSMHLSFNAKEQSSYLLQL